MGELSGTLSLKITNKGMKYSVHDDEKWEVLYTKQKLSCKQIALQTKVPISTVKAYLKRKQLLRTNRESKLGRIPWNKGKKTGQIPWNAKMKGRYPYRSPFLGKKSLQKGVSRSAAIKEKISLTHTLNRWTGCRTYKAHLLRQDFLYFCVLCENHTYFYKIGRTFYTPRLRCGRFLVKTIGLWQSTHSRIVTVESQVLLFFHDYAYRPSTLISGPTECFSINLPWLKVFHFIDFFMVALGDMRANRLDYDKVAHALKLTPYATNSMYIPFNSWQETTNRTMFAKK